VSGCCERFCTIKLTFRFIILIPAGILFALNAEEFVISSGWFAKLSKTVASKPILFAYPSDRTHYNVYKPATAHDPSDLANLRVSTVENDAGLFTEIAT
jgi:hypothetical protein